MSSLSDLTGVDDISQESSSSVGWVFWVATALIFVIFGALVVHFFIGVNIPYISATNIESAPYWGQFGDFVGGMLNPMLSFLALAAVLASLKSQSLQLKAARQEAAAARVEAKAVEAIQKEQSKLFERQNFESGFFNLLELCSKISSRIEVSDAGAEKSGVAAIEAIVYDYQLFRANCVVGDSQAVIAKRTSDFSEDFYKSAKGLLSPYLRTVLRVMTYIDSYGDSKGFNGFNLKYAAAVTSFAPLAQNDSQVYADIYASTLTSGELRAIMLYSLTSEGCKLKPLCEKYGLFRYMPSNPALDFFRSRFSPIAFR
ncbi:putative phage abortive infection protein [Pseudomonas sp. NPDC087612]|uniref:putative phage abortive infection protein n=1 Tax=Pseudomonas sp. NPDC087612 TaxID=3364441 RepID=UPI003820E52D